MVKVQWLKSPETLTEKDLKENVNDYKQTVAKMNTNRVSTYCRIAAVYSFSAALPFSDFIYWQRYRSSFTLFFRVDVISQYKSPNVVV